MAPFELCSRRHDLHENETGRKPFDAFSCEILLTGRRLDQLRAVCDECWNLGLCQYIRTTSLPLLASALLMHHKLITQMPGPWKPLRDSRLTFAACEYMAQPLNDDVGSVHRFAPKTLLTIGLAQVPMR